MSYNQILQCTVTTKALEKLEMPFEQSGAYIYTKCPECEGKMAIKAYGMKKNLTFCTKCKKSGHIISLVQKVKELEYQNATEFLKDFTLAVKPPQKINFSYELQYHKILEEAGISEETAVMLKIGVPKGRTMLAGCLAFQVCIGADPVAYYGIQLKNQKPKFHHSFNPEMCLYFPKDGNDAIFTTDIIECVKLYQEGKTAICNFGLPYISPFHCSVLNSLDKVQFKIPQELKRDFALECADSLTVYYHF